MNRILIPAAATLIVVVSLVALSGWNRSRARLVITLTERELALPPGDRDEGAELRLLVDVARRDDPLDARNWLPEERLRQLGFSLDVVANASDAGRRYGAALPRVAWVVFEYDGDAWRDIERRRLLRPERERFVLYEPSRLVPVDAGRDFDALLARYPRGHLILRAVIGLGYRGPRDGGPLVFGVIRQLVPDVLTVPRRFRDDLLRLGAPLRTTADHVVAPRYEVDVGVGGLGLPYVKDVRRLTP